ncbi:MULTISPECIES: hypothetical protein [unclassified Streptomyces]|jgi:ABC-2 type transport system permease protein|uniref:hypothetical protein n=1 Tax=unclassified Streptomyces TaxID=2593676 RepID=UPI00380A3EA3
MSTNILKAEAIKLRSLASTWWFLGIAAVVSLLFSAFAVTQPVDTDTSGIAEAMAGPGLGQLLLTLLAARSATQEFRTGTIWASHLAIPSWPKLLIGKAAVAALLTALAGTALVIGGLITAVLADSTADLAPSSVLEWRQILAVPVACAICAVLGVAVGVLLKSDGAAITVLLLWTLAGEPIMGALAEWLLGIDIGAWLPFVALSDFVGQPGAPFPGGPYTAGLYVAALAAALMIAAIRVQSRREP